MPLSKERMKERKRLDRLNVKPNSNVRLICLADIEPVKPKSNLKQDDAVIPKLPWYAGASDHFGEVRSKYYAKQFFDR